MKQEQDLVETHRHLWDFQMSFTCAMKYDQFMNWLCEEFYLFLKDKEEDLTIYFPNGEVRVKKEASDSSQLVSKLTVDSKCQYVGLKIKKKLSDFLEYTERYHKLSQI